MGFAHLPAATVPKFHWHSQRTMMLLGVSALFAATALLLPERLTHLLGHHPIEIGQIVDQFEGRSENTGAGENCAGPESR